MTIEILSLRFRRLSLQLKREVRRTFESVEEKPGEEGMDGMSYEEALAEELEPFLAALEKADEATRDQFRRQLMADKAPAGSAAAAQEIPLPMPPELARLLCEASLKKYERLLLAAAALSPEGEESRLLSRGMILGQIRKAGYSGISNDSAGSNLRSLLTKGYLEQEKGSELYKLTTTGRTAAAKLHQRYAYDTTVNNRAAKPSAV